MSAFCDQIRATLGVRPEIDPQAEISRRVQFLVEYCLTCAARGFVLGISGGQDSALAGRLCQLAAEELRRRGSESSFVAVRLPYRVQADEDDAQLALDFISPDESVVVNIGSTTDALTEELTTAVGQPISDFNKGNIKARMRMVAQYAIAGERKMLVVGTDHAAEAVTGFFTKFGDGGADIVPLSGLTKRQGKELLQALEAPRRLYEKDPTADLLDEQPGQSDESSLGVSYTDIDNFLEGKDVAEDVSFALEDRYRNTEHKRMMPVGPNDSWWIRV